MTLEELVTRVFTALGEPSDLQIYQFGTTTVDTAATGWRTLVDVVNQSQLELSTWKFPDGHQLRVRFNDALTMFQTKTATGAITSYTTGIAVLSGLTDGTDLYKNWLLETPTGSALVLTSYGAGGSTTCYLVKIAGTISAAQVVTLRQREYVWTAVTAPANPVIQTGIPYVIAQGRPLEIISVYDVENETDLGTLQKTDSKAVVASTTGTPANFVKLPSGVRLDVWPDDTYTYAVRYMRGPALLGYTDNAVEPELPPQLHKGLELLGIWWGYRRAQESTDAYAVKRDLYDFLKSVRTEYDLQDELRNGQMKFYPEGR